MDDDVKLVTVSPRHSVLLASELFALVERAPSRDFVVRTLARHEANGMPLMAAELVIAGLGHAPGSPGGRRVSPPLSQDLLPGPAARRPARGVRLPAPGLPALSHPAAHRPRPGRVPQLLAPRPALRPPHPLRRGPAGEQHRHRPEAAAGHAGRAVAAGRGAAGPAGRAPPGWPRPRGRRAPRLHRLPGPPRGAAHRLRIGRSARGGRGGRLERPLSAGSRRPSCARRSTCSARSGDSRATLGELSRAELPRLFARPDPFHRAIETRARV